MQPYSTASGGFLRPKGCGLQNILLKHFDYNRNPDKREPPSVKKQTGETSNHFKSVDYQAPVLGLTLMKFGGVVGLSVFPGLLGLLGLDGFTGSSFGRFARPSEMI